eukprot:sb/3478981/
MDAGCTSLGVFQCRCLSASGQNCVSSIPARRRKTNHSPKITILVLLANSRFRPLGRKREFAVPLYRLEVLGPLFEFEVRDIESVSTRVRLVGGLPF